MTRAKELTYRQALDELEQLLADIESEDVDVDVLAVKVQRAAELVAICRERIAGARTAVDRVVVELAEAATDPEEDVDSES